MKIIELVRDRVVDIFGDVNQNQDSFIYEKKRIPLFFSLSLCRNSFSAHKDS